MKHLAFLKKNFGNNSQSNNNNRTDSQSRNKTLPFLVVEIARNLGALGVRFLQLLPQFVELTDEEQDEFSKVYDANEGQSKLTALAVLEREWPTYGTK